MDNQTHQLHNNVNHAIIKCRGVYSQWARILLQIAPPVMLAQLIQALYNIVDSFFVGQYSNKHSLHSA